MKTPRLVIAVTVINLALLLLTLMQTRSTTAQPVPSILRGRTLELVDERGVVRARLGVKGGPNGPIELDLFSRSGTVGVKLGAGEDGSGLLLSEEGTSTSRGYVQIIARQTGTSEKPKTTSITLRGADGRERVITPP